MLPRAGEAMQAHLSESGVRIFKAVLTSQSGFSVFSLKGALADLYSCAA